MKGGERFWNPKLGSNWSPVNEERDLKEVEASFGSLPDDLSGVFIRNGPNPQFPPLGSYHLFEGDGMVHAAFIKDKKLRYLNAYVRTDDFEIERQEARSVFYSFLDYTGVKGMASLLWGLIGRPALGMRRAVGKHSSNTNVVHHSRRILSLVESNKPTMLEPNALTTVGEYDFNGKLKFPFSAHPKIDQETGELFVVSYQLKKPFCIFHHVDPQGVLSETVSIDIPAPVMMHDSALTQTRVVILDLPLAFRPKNIAQSKGVFEFDPLLPSRFGLIDRHAKPGDQPSWFSSESGSFYIFHTATAWDCDNGDVVLVAVRLNSISVMELDELAVSESDGMGKLWLWRISPSAGRIVEDRELYNDFVEFPIVPSSLIGRSPCRFVYAAVSSLANATTDEEKNADGIFNGFIGIAKIDILSGEKTLKRIVKGVTGGEWVFVPRKDAIEEDDGYLLSFVYQRDDPSLPLSESKSLFQCLNAKDLSLLCSFVIPGRIPFGFHATFIPQEDLEQCLSKL